MQAGRSHRVAVVDIGTNSTRLLVADVAGGRVTRGRAAQPGDPARPRRRPLRAALGRGDRGGLRGDRRLRGDLHEEADVRASSLDRDQRRARRVQRQTPSSPSCASASRSRPGCSTASEEARLTYLGATAEHPPTAPDAGHRHRRRLDRADRRHRRRDRLPRLAAGRRRPPHRAPHRLRPAGHRASSRRSPPTSRGPDRGGHRGTARRDAEAGIARRRHPDLAGRDRDGPRALRPRASPRAYAHPACDPAPALAPRLGAALDERGEIPGLHPDRAPTIVAGVVILVETMRAFGLEQVEVSEHDILYGVAIEAAAALDCG